MSLKEVILALLVAISTSLMVSSAKAQQAIRGHDGGWHNGGHGPQQPSVPDTGDRDQAVGSLNSYVQNQNIDLTALLQLAQPYRRGEIVDSVAVYTAATGSVSSLYLIADGRVVASASSTGGIITLIPAQMVQISGYQGQIYLQVQGTAYISQVVMSMHRLYAPPAPVPGPPLPMPGPIPQPLPPSQQQVVLSANLSGMGSNATVDLVSLMNVNAYRGYHLQSLIIIGRAAVAGGQGVADLSINNVAAGQAVFTGMTQQQSIPLRGAWIAGLNTQQMLLQLRGVQAGQVQLVLTQQ